ncbi:hypothetical protein PENARI_c001G05206 [Penicillium arizonense]|uniref:Uncharacterized protein n=1 Tax=Penicillium arizonense TaxID=1835702 RepID=A0A1F5LXX0_PENAI|nr:hypothetical protein PENARI_c001G05206 [Penicillium arizonense]OGE58007.1 hypothetical protein PENARI_c001G05206 [Penicillium arizonense]
MVVLLLRCKDLDVNPTRYTPLMLAAMYGHTKTMELLLKGPRLVNKRDPRTCCSALMLAAIKNKLDAVRMLLNHPEIDLNLQEYSSGNTALIHRAQRGYSGVVELLLARGADMEVLQYKTKGTALNIAVCYGQTSIVQTLPEHGADHRRTDYLGAGILHWAASTGRPDILRVLLEFDKTLDVNMQDANGKTPLHDTARQGSIGTATILLETPGLRKIPATPLMAEMASLARPVNFQLVNIPVPNRTLMSMAMISRDLMPWKRGLGSSNAN